MNGWPDTTDVASPVNNSPWHQARWLVGRHPALARLVARIPGVVEWQDDGPWVVMEVLVQAIRDVDAYMSKWEAYKTQTYEPYNEGEWGQWRAAGPQPSGTVHAVLVMSRTEQARLRLLATVGDRVGFSIGELWGLDWEGQRLVQDWCTLVMSQ